MLWYRTWLETRWRFLAGLALLILSAAGVVFAYRQVAALMPLVPNVESNSELGRRIHEAAALAREYRGYVWVQWFRQSLANTWTVFAVLLGTGGLLAQTANGSALFTLALPVTRRRLMGIRAATGLAELLALTLVPSLVITLLSPAIGERYSLVATLVHSACFFIGGTVFFSLAFLLSTVWADIWRPLLVALCAAVVLSLCEQVSTGFARYGIFHVMSGEEYFRNGAVPWIGLAITATVSAVMVYGAFVNIERRDF
jgi:ABC-2 type transport system permease protein